MTTPSPEALALKPCRRCGADCSVQEFPSAGTLWMCSNCIPLKGTCSEDAYYTAEAWNQRPTPTDSGEVVQGAHELALKRYPILAVERVSTSYSAMARPALREGYAMAITDHRLAFSRPEPVGAGEPGSYPKSVWYTPEDNSSRKYIRDDIAEGWKEACDNLVAGSADDRDRALLLIGLLERAREYVADALDAHEHSDGRQLLNEIDAALATPPHLPPTEPVGDEALVERAVMACPQCEGEGGYPDGTDEDACHTDCTRCGGNGWIVDLAAIQAIPAPATDAGQSAECVSCDGLNLSCPDGCERDPVTGELASLPKSPSAGEEA